MRKVLYLLLALLPTLSVSAQNTTYQNFKLVDQEIIYQKVTVQDSVTLDKLADYYKTLPYISKVEKVGNEIRFDVNDLIVDYKKFQFTQVATPNIIQTGRYSGKAYVGVKDGRYRLTVQSIQLTGNIGYKNITTKDNLTNYAAKNNGTVLAPDWCRPNMLGLLDQAFTDKLQYIETERKKDTGDW